MVMWFLLSFWGGIVTFSSGVMGLLGWTVAVKGVWIVRGRGWCAHLISQGAALDATDWFGCNSGQKGGIWWPHDVGRAPPF
ncbi:hypothetical protein Pint_17728 [Pistacia integerrima]|uniref:Uncharacterized protein n=1 Tax=Pistacia integerrima TaxID=434235 RepID=A0ACC0YTP9_9ROSI|nr:hypothetical protein Pint_17728 [Pistacia integerrima]